MKNNTRGRHQSTDKSDKRWIKRLRAVSGVTAVIIGRSIGGKSLAAVHQGFKVQSTVPGGLKGILQTSKGIQEIFIRIEGDIEAVKLAILAL